MLAEVCSLSMGVGFSFLQKHLCFIFAPCHTFLCVCGGVRGSEAPCHVHHSTERECEHILDYPWTRSAIYPLSSDYSMRDVCVSICVQENVCIFTHAIAHSCVSHLCDCKTEPV